MKDTALDKTTIEELRRRHVAFLRARLRSDAVREDLEHGLRDGWEWARSLRLREIVDADALTDSLARVLTDDAVRTLAAPAARDLARRAVASLKRDETVTGDYVPEAARAAIDELLSRPGFVPDRLVRRVLEQEAVEEAIRDTLYDALTEFNDTVNPFFAEWGLPAVASWMPIGGGVLLASMGTLRAEFDKRLEPEIRKFLLAFSRKARGQLADFFIARASDPKVAALRRSVVAFVYSQSLRDLLHGLDDVAVDAMNSAAEGIVLEALAHDSPRERLREALASFVEEQGDATLGEWLASVGADGAPDFEAWTELLWHPLQIVLQGPVVLGFLEGLTAEFYDSL
jgi:hypothetical protein